MTLLDYAIIILATYRLTNMLNWERGLFAVFERFRSAIGVQPLNVAPEFYAEPYAKNELGKAVICFACLSVWTALVVYVTYDLFFGLWVVLAISGAVMKLGEWKKENGD